MIDLEVRVTPESLAAAVDRDCTPDYKITLVTAADEARPGAGCRDQQGAVMSALGLREPEPALTAAEALADAYRTLAGVARQCSLPLPPRVDYWISEDRAEDEARAIIAAAGTALAAAGILFEPVADDYRLGLVLHFDGILAYRITWLRPAASQARGRAAAAPRPRHGGAGAARLAELTAVPA
jgi:hypothetical protein